MAHHGARGFRQQGQRRRERLVERLSAQRAAHHQQMQRTRLACRLDSRLGRMPGGTDIGDLIAHRIAHHLCSEGGREGAREGGVDTRRHPRQHLVGQARDGVLLMNDQRNAFKARREPAWTTGEATEAHHQHRLELTDHAPRLQNSTRETKRNRRIARQPLATQARDLDPMQRVAGVRHQAILDATRAAQPMNLVTGRREGTRQRQRRDHMPSRAAGHHQHDAPGDSVYRVDRPLGSDGRRR